VVTQDIAQPVFSIATPALLNCFNPTTTLHGSGAGFGNTPVFKWSTNNGNILSGSNTLYTQIDAPGTYTLSILNSQNGCSDTHQVQVNGDFVAPPLSTEPVLPLTCHFTQRILTANTIPQALLQWSTLNGNIVAGATTPHPVVNEPGLYTVQVTSTGNGCTAAVQVPVLQEQNIPVGLQFSVQPPGCNGLQGSLTVEKINGGVGPFEYSLDGGQSFSPGKDFDGLEPGEYDLVIRDQNGCELAQNLNIPVPQIPELELSPAFKIQLGEAQSLEAIIQQPFPMPLIDQVIWEPITGLSFEGNSVLQLLKPIAQPFRTTEYNLTIITKGGCKASARTIIRVDRNLDIYFPNVIWPEDPDGQNAAFTLFSRPGSVKQIVSLQVFDRWGEKVFVNRNFQPDDPSVGWSGDFKSQIVNPGVFVWWAEVELVDGQTVTLKGDVTVVR
jgi:hypothetical protein